MTATAFLEVRQLRAGYREGSCGRSAATARWSRRRSRLRNDGGAKMIDLQRDLARLEFGVAGCRMSDSMSESRTRRSDGLAIDLDGALRNEPGQVSPIVRDAGAEPDQRNRERPAPSRMSS